MAWILLGIFFPPFAQAASKIFLYIRTHALIGKCCLLQTSSFLSDKLNVIVDKTKWITLQVSHIIEYGFH